MVIDQSEIDALLAEAEGLAVEAEDLAGQPAASRRGAAPAGTRAGPPVDFSSAPPPVRALLRIRVPVIARLAQRKVPLAEARKLALGMIVEFQQSAENSLEMMVNNRVIGRAEAVKVGEHFGLRVLEIHPVADRIRAMGAG